MKKIKGTTWALLLGIAVFLVGCIQPSRYEQAKENGYEVDAVVTRVEEGTDPGMDGVPDSIVYTYYGDYEVDGKQYTNKKLQKGYDHQTYCVGDTIRIVVDPNNPGVTMFEGGVICTIGFVIAVGAIIFKISDRKKAKQSENAG